MKKSTIKITDLKYSYPGDDTTIFDNINHEIYAGEILGVTGKNGVGKSTLLRLLAGFHQPIGGNITINGIDSCDFDKRRDYLLNFVYISHDKFVEYDLTIEDYYKIHSTLYPNYSKKNETFLLNFFKLNSKKKISALSTGSKMKAFLVFALASRVEMVFIDEITAVLDPGARVEFFEMIKLYAEEGMTFVVATNIIDDFTDIIMNRVWFIQDNKILETNTASLKEHFKKKAA